MSLKLSCEAVVVFSVFLFATAFAVTWKDCGSKLGNPTDVRVQGCSSPGACVLHKGVNVSFGVDFKSNEDATSLKMLVYGHLAGVDVPFPLDNPDVCKDSNVTCPVNKDQSYSYRNQIFVKSSYPSTVEGETSISLGMHDSQTVVTDVCGFCLSCGLARLRCVGLFGAAFAKSLWPRLLSLPVHCHWW